MKKDQLNWQRDNFENIDRAWEGDLWGRRRLGEQLEQYVDRLNCGAVLALDARWGEGKTWFVRHWTKHLTNTEHNVIYLDAFANDYLDDPFLTIAAEISQAFRNSDEISEQDIEDFNSKTASVLISLAAVFPMIAAKAGMHWIGIGGAGEVIQEVYNQGKDVFDVASDEIASKVKEQIEKKIENHHIEKQTIQDFKKELAELANQLEKPLVIIIDELDRCRPDFAIRLIERIKHFFDIPKIVFVLVMDKAQFSKVVCHNYGYEQKLGEEYLDKFLDFLIPLPKISYASKKYVMHFDALRNFLRDVGEYASDVCLIFYFSQYGEYLSPREIRKKINIYALFKTSNQKANLFLALAIMSNPENLIVKMLQLEKLILDHHSTKFIQIGRGEWKLNSVEQRKQTLEAAILTEFNAKTPIFLEFLDSYKSIQSKTFAFDGGDNYKDDQLTQLFSNYSISKIDDYREFSNHFDAYLKSCLWFEN